MYKSIFHSDWHVDVCIKHNRPRQFDASYALATNVPMQCMPYIGSVISLRCIYLLDSYTIQRKRDMWRQNVRLYGQSAYGTCIPRTICSRQTATPMPMMAFANTFKSIARNEENDVEGVVVCNWFNNCNYFMINCAEMWIAKLSLSFSTILCSRSSSCSAATFAVNYLNCHQLR